MLFLSPGEYVFGRQFGIFQFQTAGRGIVHEPKAAGMLEEQVEAVLPRMKFITQKTELFIDSEELYEVLYEMEV